MTVQLSNAKCKMQNAKTELGFDGLERRVLHYSVH